MLDSVRISNRDGGIIEMIPIRIFGAKGSVVTGSGSRSMVNNDGGQVI